MLVDEIDAIAGKRESAQREMERRIVAQMLTCMDDLASPRPAKKMKPNEGQPAVNAARHVLVIGAQLTWLLEACFLNTPISLLLRTMAGDERSCAHLYPAHLQCASCKSTLSRYFLHTLTLAAFVMDSSHA